MFSNCPDTFIFVLLLRKDRSLTLFENGISLFNVHIKIVFLVLLQSLQ